MIDVEINKVEMFVNEWIGMGVFVIFEEMVIVVVKEKGVIVMFGEKYGE